MELNWLVDNIIWAYVVAVVAIIVSFWFYKEKKGGSGSGSGGSGYGSDHGSSGGSGVGGMKRGVSVGSLDWQVNWRECMQGQWKQVEAENLDNFGLLSNQSKIRRTLGSLAFYRVRHKISFQEVPAPSGDEDGDGEGSGIRFCLLRDLGEGMQEWSVEAVIGTSRDTAEVVERRVDTPGYEKMYRYRVWIEEKHTGDENESERSSECDHLSNVGGELLMESEPVEVDEDSIKTLQVRSLLSKNKMKMVSLT